MTPPQIIILAGPNGAGKSTLSRLPALAHLPFLNADDIERDQAAGPLKAGRTLLAQLQEFAAGRNDFLIETTLAGKWLLSHLVALRAQGYQVRILFVWLPSAELSIARVASRVRAGGHNIPEATIRRRYKRGIRNFVRTYAPLAHTWMVFDNSKLSPQSVAFKGADSGIIVLNPERWQTIQEQ